MQQSRMQPTCKPYTVVTTAPFGTKLVRVEDTLNKIISLDVCISQRHDVTINSVVVQRSQLLRAMDALSMPTLDKENPRPCCFVSDLLPLLVARRVTQQIQQRQMLLSMPTPATLHMRLQLLRYAPLEFVQSNLKSHQLPFTIAYRLGRNISYYLKNVSQNFAPAVSLLQFDADIDRHQPF